MRAAEFVVERKHLLLPEDDNDSEVDDSVVAVLMLIAQEIKDAQEADDSVKSTLPMEVVMQKIKNAGIDNFTEEDLVDMASNSEVEGIISNASIDEVTFDVGDKGPEANAASTTEVTPKPASPKQKDTVGAMARHAMNSSK